MRFSTWLRAGLVGAVLLATPALADVVVTSPAGLLTNAGPTNLNGPGAGSPDTWFAANIRGGASVGITGAYPNASSGSIEFSGPTGAKADLEYYFSAPNQFLLSQLSSLSYEFYRASSSTAAAHFHPSLRLFVSDGTNSGYLVYEGIYNGVPVAPVDTWVTVAVTNSVIWSTGSLPDNFNTPIPNYSRTAADWAALLPGLKVLGLSTGIGSGWNGSFEGAVDRISYATTTGQGTTFNFEVEATAVPEPASLALLGAGLVGLGVFGRRRKPAAA